MGGVFIEVYFIHVYVYLIILLPIFLCSGLFAKEIESIDATLNIVIVCWCCCCATATVVIVSMHFVTLGVLCEYTAGCC